MGETLTGESAALFMAAMLDSANRGRPIDVRAVARDALAARSSRKAMGRLRLATVRVRPVPRCSRPRERRRAFHVKTRAASTRRCSGAGDDGRPKRGFR